MRVSRELIWLPPEADWTEKNDAKPMTTTANTAYTAKAIGRRGAGSSRRSGGLLMRMPFTRIARAATATTAEP